MLFPSQEVVKVNTFGVLFDGSKSNSVTWQPNLQVVGLEDGKESDVNVESGSEQEMADKVPLDVEENLDVDVVDPCFRALWYLSLSESTIGLFPGMLMVGR